MRFDSLWILCLLVFTCLAGNVSAQELVVAPDDSPMYKLSKLRMESDRFGRAVVAFDYELTREGKPGTGRVQVSGKTKRGELNVIGMGIMDDSGTLRFSNHGVFGGGNDYEVYFVSNALNSTEYLVSNIVRMGNPGPKSKARPLTEKEKESNERARLHRTPPESLPEGYQAVDQGTKLVPGMPVKAGSYGQWKDAEVISFKVAGPVVLKYEGQSDLESHPREKWMAVDPKVLSQVESDASQFKVSARALPNSTKIIPDGAIALTDDIDLAPGTPLLLDDHGSKWTDVFAMDTQGDQINLRHAKFGAMWDRLHPRTKLVVTEDVVSQLKSSNREAVEKKFAKNLIAGGPASNTSFPTKVGDLGNADEVMGKMDRMKLKMRRHQYKIDISIPKSAQLVPEDLTIEEGTALAVCSLGKWEPTTALRENADGSLHVRFDKLSDAWDCDLPRDLVIIQDKTVRKLRKKQDSSGGSLAKTLRTWTDITGKHKIEARFVKRTEDELTIKTDAGREITMPIEKLSEADRELLPAWQDDSDNPFK